MENGIIFLCMIHIATGSLSKTAYRVDDCPEANNITAWKKASLRLNCSEFSEKYSVDVLKGQKLYHCLPSSFLNETIEFCGPNAAIERGDCPIYNYRYGATTATSHSCKHFTKGCPDPKYTPYHSSSFYKCTLHSLVVLSTGKPSFTARYALISVDDKACWDINKESQCFYAEPDCPQREDKRFTTTSIGLRTSTSTEGNTKRPNAAIIVSVCIVLCLMGVVIGLLFYFLKYKKKPKEKMDTLSHGETGHEIDDSRDNNIEADTGEHIQLQNLGMETNHKGSFEEMDTLLRGENDHEIDDSRDNNIEVDTGEHINTKSKNLGMETHHKGSFEGIIQPQTENKSNTLNDSGVEQCEDNVGKQIKLIKNMRKGASIWCFNSFMEKLKVAMTPNVLENIKCLLQERAENSKTDVTKIGNTEELLNYLDGKYFLLENVCFLQGLFLASEAPKLYEICVEYAKHEDKKVIFFEKGILDNDHTKVQYSINVPNVSSYPKSCLEELRETIASLLFANYDDVIVSGVKNGSVIVTLMIRNYLIPGLKALLKSEERIICQKLLEMKIFKVVIQDDTVYIRDQGQGRIKAESRPKGLTLERIGNESKYHSLSADISDLITKLDRTPSQWKVYDESVQQLSHWLTGLVDQLKAKRQLHNTLEEKRLQLERVKVIQEEIMSKQVAFNSPTDRAQTLLQSTTENRITSRLTQLSFCYTSLIASSKELLNRFEQHAMDHQYYAEAYSDAVTWLQTNKERLCVSADNTGDRSKIQTQLKKLQSFVVVKKEAQLHINNVETWGEKTMNHTSMEGCEKIRKELQQLHKEWDSIVYEVMNTKFMIGSSFQQWSEYNDCYEKIQIWLNVMEKRLQETQAKAYFGEKISEEISEVERLEGIHEEIMKKQAAFDYLAECAQTLLQSTTDNSVTSQLTQLSSRYASLIASSKTHIDNTDQSEERPTKKGELGLCIRDAEDSTGLPELFEEEVSTIGYTIDGKDIGIKLQKDKSNKSESDCSAQDSDCHPPSPTLQTPTLEDLGMKTVNSCAGSGLSIRTEGLETHPRMDFHPRKVILIPAAVVPCARLSGTRKAMAPRRFECSRRNTLVCKKLPESIEETSTSLDDADADVEC